MFDHAKRVELNMSKHACTCSNMIESDCFCYSAETCLPVYCAAENSYFAAFRNNDSSGHVAIDDVLQRAKLKCLKLTTNSNTYLPLMYQRQRLN